MQITLGIVAGTIASLGIVAVTSGGFALSFDAIRTIARAAHINADLDWMLPVTIDGAMAVASVTAIVMQKLGRTPWYPWVVVLANVLISVGCNALHAYQGGGEKPLPSEWAMAVSAIPAINLALSLHLLIELVMAVANRGEKKAADTQAAKSGLAQFAPTVIHGGTHPQPQPATQVARTLSPMTVAPALSPAKVNGSHPGSLNGTQPAKQAPAQVEQPIGSHDEKSPASPPAQPAAKPIEKPIEQPAAKPDPAAKRPTHPLSEDPNPSMRALAKAYSRNPAKTNAELAKLAKVSVGTANRYMPQIRAAAVDSANADADEERALSPLNDLPTNGAKTLALAGISAHPISEENR
uniref:DUF2637 domain-containing protein n=1 Tax=Paractinoplanes polyasparticus TaxID=2856853 RepID=UPI001C85A82D|nr:DUF2637 domain-containing protein [Actinoplanes polyasparticus]